MFPTVSKVK